MRLVGSRAVAVAVAAIALLTIVVVIAGCPPKPTESEPPPVGPKTVETPSAPTGEPVKVGAIFAVTGSAAPLGEPEQRTVEMLVEQINAEGGVLGRPLEVTVKDNKSQPGDADIACKDLIDSGVVAVIGPSTTPDTMAIKDKCEKGQVPLVSCAAGKTITDPVASYVFAVPQTNTLAAEKMLGYITKQSIKSIAILSVDNGYGKDGLANTQAAAKKQSVEVVASESYGPDDTDMTAQLTRIKAKKPGAIVIWGTNPGPAIAMKNAQKLGIDVPLIQSHGVANAKFLELAGDAANGVQLPAGRLIVVDQIPADDPQKTVLDKFAGDFKAKYSADADTFAGHAYDALMIVVEAVKRAGDTDRAKVRDEIEKTSGFVGTAGIFTYSATDHNGLTADAFVWVTVEDGKWKLAD